MAGVFVLIVGVFGGAGFWWLFRRFACWVETGRFRSVRRG